ncbi:MAG: hypothetical protein QM650_10515 [Microlunatus sp.]
MAERYQISIDEAETVWPRRASNRQQLLGLREIAQPVVRSGRTRIESSRPGER